MIGVLTSIVSCGSSSPPRTVRQADLDAWTGIPLVELETHPLFSTLPRNVRALSDGTQLWTFSNCKSIVEIYCTGPTGLMTCSGGETWRPCCQNQFVVRDAEVESFRAVGHCYTDCTVRPASRRCGSEGSFEMSSTAASPKEDARLVAIRRSPKPAPIGATVAEARVICEQQRGRLVESDGVVECHVGRAPVFACRHGEQQMRTCDTYYEGGDLTAFAQAAEKQYGPPPSVQVSKEGFRVFSWPAVGYSVTMYPKGVRVTVSRPD
jgi:hypothetical protein